MSSLANREFVDQMESANEALYRASEMQVEAFFKANPSKEALFEHFAGRCVNEHMNMVEVARRLVEAAPKGDRKALKHLAKQILDEAVHFDLVAGVLEHISGKPVNMDALLETEGKGGGAKGARILEECDSDDLVALYTYQFIAEGRAHRVWQKMADIIQDEKISAAYQKIADDEKVHREFGRIGLESVINTPELQVRALELAQKMRHQLYQISCMNCVEVPEARALCVEAYGNSFLKH